jgi:hypothetical protein
MALVRPLLSDGDVHYCYTAHAYVLGPAPPGPSPAQQILAGVEAGLCLDARGWCARLGLNRTEWGIVSKAMRKKRLICLSRDAGGYIRGPG